MRKLLGSWDYGTIDSELGSASDVELLLNFILHVCVASSRSLGIRYLLPIATPQRQPDEFWYSRCQPKSQETDVRFDLQEKRHARVLISH